MKIGVIKYNAGNAQSLLFALERLGQSAQLCESPEQLQAVDKVIFPGVGHAATAMHALRMARLDEALICFRKPILGICLGMQLMCKLSEEGPTECLGMFPEKIKRIDFSAKVPHTGWNQLFALRGSLFKGFEQGQRVYFVHSYYMPLCEFSSAQVNYGQTFSAAIERDNFFGVQFHPEKSGATGELVLRNFLNL